MKQETSRNFKSWFDACFILRGANVRKFEKIVIFNKWMQFSFLGIGIITQNYKLQ